MSANSRSFPVTITATSTVFNMSAANVVSVTASGSGSLVVYDQGRGTPDVFTVNETPLAISTASQWLIPVTLTSTGTTQYINVNMIIDTVTNSASGTDILYRTVNNGPINKVVVNETRAALVILIDAVIATGGGGSVQTGLTAFAGGGQASATQTVYGTNEFTTVATAGDSGKLPAGVVGGRVVVLNDGANTMDLFPATGGTINDGAANAAIQIPPGNEVVFIAISATNWETDAQTLAAGNGTVALPSHTFSSDPDLGLYRIGANNMGISANGVKQVDISTTGTEFSLDVTLAKEVNHSINVTASTTATVAGGNLIVASGTGNTSGAGGSMTIAAGAGGNAGVGGLVTVTTGAGANGTSGTANGAMTITTGLTGTATTGTGGAGATMTISGAAGGAASGAAGIGGVGSAITIATGAGGASSSATGGNSGAGGNLIISAAAGGSAAGAAVTAGAAGNINITGSAGGACTNAAGGVETGGAGTAIIVAAGAGGAINAASTGTSGAGGNLTLTAGNAGAANGGTSGAAGAVSITAGNAVRAVTGGAVTITAGVGGATGVGGAITVTSGAGGTTSGNSGAVTIKSAATTAAASNTGAMTFASGNATLGDSGAVSINTGSAAGGTIGTVQIGTGGTTYWVINASGALVANVNNTYDIGNGASDPRDLNLGRHISLAKEVNHNISVVTTTTAATAGGNLALTAGQGATSGAGGTASLTAGAGGTSGAGGTATVTSGAGANGTAGTTNGAVTISTGANGTATTGAGGTGALLSITGAAGGAATGAAGSGGVGSQVSIVSGNGGATTDAAGGAGGAGAAVVITAGNGGAVTNAASAGGAGGAITITAGNAGAGSTAGTAGGAVNIVGGNGVGTAGGPGNINITPGTTSMTTVAPVTILNKGLAMKPTASSVASGGTITGKELVQGLITGTGATGNWQLPTAAQITTAIGATPTGTWFDFFFNAAGMTATNTATLVVGAGMTVMSAPPITGGGTLTVTQDTQVVGCFRIMFDSATTCKISRIA